MIHANVVADGQIDPATIVVSDTIIPVPNGRIAIYAGSTVESHRFMEMQNGWSMLWRGVRDRNLLNAQFKGSVLYSGVDVNSCTENNRRTASVVTSFTNNDVIIGIAPDVSNNFSGAVLQLDVAFEKLRDVAKEQVFNVA
jgi:hypothetical protein